MFGFLMVGVSFELKEIIISIWKDVCLSKNEGGLGLRSIEEANKVCCLKLIWRILSST